MYKKCFIAASLATAVSILLSYPQKPFLDAQMTSYGSKHWRRRDTAF